MIRWFWWRVNAWTEFSGMIASGITASYIHYYYPDWLYSQKLLVTVSVSTFVWVTVTLLTKPVKREVLIDFVKLVKPGYFGWKGIYQQTNIEPHNFLSNGLKLSLMGLVAFFSLNFGIGFLILKSTMIGLALLLIGCFVGYKIFSSVKT